MHKSKPAEEPVRRIEVFTGAGRRRSWTSEEKARIIADSYAGGDSVCGVARRHGSDTATAVRVASRGAPAYREPCRSGAAAFVPATVEAALPAPGQKLTRKTSRAGVIEVEIDGASVRVGRGAEARTVAAVIRALKAGA
jgi:transposase